MGMPAQPDQDQFRFRRAAFYSSLKSKVGLIAAKAAALRINMNTDSCLIASRAASWRLASSHATSLLNSSLSHHLPRPQTLPPPSLVCGVDTQSYTLRPSLLHSTNSLSTHNLRPSPSYSSSCNKHLDPNLNKHKHCSRLLQHPRFRV